MLIVRVLKFNLDSFSCLVGNDFTKEELEKSPQFLEALFRACGSKAGGNVRSTQVIKSVVMYCNHALCGLSLEDQLGVIESQLLKTCRNRSTIVHAMDEAVKAIDGLSGDKKKRRLFILFNFLFS